ncbi:MAG: GntR family transcriptional regulator [Rhizobiaceae bacterium]
MKNKPSRNALPIEAELEFDQIDRSQPMRDQIYTMIRSLILTGVLSPGGTLEEKSIARRLGVSRTPVREAVQKLSDENLVDVKPQSGTRVTDISYRQVHQAFIIRRALESETVAAAAANMTAKDEARLERNYVQHKLAIEREHFVDAIRIDDEFHQTIADIADLPMLWRAITISKAQLDRCRHMAVPKEGYGESTLQQHRAILDALKGRDEALASQMMQSHLDQTYRGIHRFMQTDQDDSHRSRLQPGR